MDVAADPRTLAEQSNGYWCQAFLYALIVVCFLFKLVLYGPVRNTRRVLLMRYLDASADPANAATHALGLSLYSGN